MRRIILLRHGEVDFKNHKSISAYEFKEWIAKYNSSDIKCKFPAKDKIKTLFEQADILVCSNLKRSIQSVEIFEKIPYEIDAVFNEAQIPYTNWNLLKLNPKIWLVFFRVLWLFRYSKNSESFQEAKNRAKKATQRLVELSKQNKTVVLIGHGVINKLIQKELLLQKWKETKKIKRDNWDYGIYEFKSIKI